RHQSLVQRHQCCRLGAFGTTSSVRGKRSEGRSPTSSVISPTSSVLSPRSFRYNVISPREEGEAERVKRGKREEGRALYILQKSNSPPASPPSRGGKQE
ncbi:hypothetical protein, partial [Tychonema sp. LEGE 06208]|uniref:hypothetical protein n=1 Tax=Tychonema sp. LEGE 06208 TaxID=1828663 RepID=UPI001D158169